MYPSIENSTTGIAITEGPVPTGVMGASNENMLEDMEGMLDSGILCQGCNSTLATCDV